MDDLARTVALLKAKDDIRELTARYCWFATRADGEALADLFTDDCFIEIGPDNVVRGKTAIAELVSSAGRGSLVPVISNHVIEVAGDDATGTCVVQSRVSPRSPAGFVACYRDSYRNSDRGWRFVSRRYQLYVLDGQAVGSFD